MVFTTPVYAHAATGSFYEYSQDLSAPNNLARMTPIGAYIMEANKIPSGLYHKYYGHRGADVGEALIHIIDEADDIYFHYVDMAEIANLFTDGSYTKASDGTMTFKFGGNTVSFKDKSNTIVINGKTQYMGKVRYMDSVPLNPNGDPSGQMGKLPYSGLFMGNKIAYETSMVSYGTWIPVNAIDNLIAYGFTMPGFAGIMGVNVPAAFKSTTSRFRYVNKVYNSMVDKLPASVKSQIKPVSRGDSLIFGEDYSDVDNFEQMAKMIHKFIEVTDAKSAIDDTMSVDEIVQYLKNAKEEGRESFSVISGSNPGVCRPIYDLEFTFYLNGLERKNGVAWRVEINANNEIYRSIMSAVIQEVYPYEISDEFTIRLLMPPTYKYTREVLSEMNLVQAFGQFKFFFGKDIKNTPENKTEYGYMLMDHHPAMPNEYFIGDNDGLRYQSHTAFIWAKGYREDFFTGRVLSDSVKKTLGIPKIWNTLIPENNRRYIEWRKANNLPITLKANTCDPYGYYGSLKGSAVTPVPVRTISPPSSWAASEVNTAKNWGLVPVSVTENYQAPITRKQFAELVVKAIEAKTGRAMPTGEAFADANEDYISKVRNAAIVNGVGDNQYRPNGNITRQEMAIMIVNMMKHLGINCKDFTGPEESLFTTTAAWAKPQMKIAYATGLVKGDGKTLNPLGTTSCEQSILIVLRVFKQLI